MADSIAGGRSSGVGCDLDRERRAGGERGERGLEAAVGEHRRVDPAGELAQLGERFVELGARAGEHLGGALGIGDRAVAGEPQAQPDRDQALLGAVVEVALEAAAFGEARLHDARARGAQVFDTRAQLGVRRWFSRARATAAPAPCTRSRPSSSAESWTIAATCWPSWSISVALRPEPGAGRSTSAPSTST